MTWAYQPKNRSLKGTPVEAAQQRAFSHFQQLGFPTHRTEAWRTTSLTALAKIPFGEPDSKASRLDAAPDAAITARIRFELDQMPGDLLVFINGFYSKEFSKVSSHVSSHLSSHALGVRMERTRASLLEGKISLWESEADSNPFVWLNTAQAQDGLSLVLEEGVHLPTPLHCVQIAIAPQGAEGIISFPRNQIHMGKNAHAVLVESFLGFGTGPHLTNAVTQVRLAAGAQVEHFRLENAALPVFSTLRVEQFENSRWESHAVVIGTTEGTTRSESTARLNGSGAEAIFNGIFKMGGHRHADHHVAVEHLTPNTRSDQHYRAILDGHAVGAFTGKVRVHPGAVKTQARQLSKTLLLSKDALMHSRPQLEIDTDDVQCSHGATIGQVDAAALFYLRSRGLSLEAAQSLLTEAFASDGLARMKSEPVKVWIEGLLGRGGVR